MAWRDADADVPMGLGDHLHELRRRLIIPLITIAVVSIAAFVFQDELKRYVVWPLKRSLQMTGPEITIRLGFFKDKADFDSLMSEDKQLLAVFSLGEDASAAMWVSIAAGLAVALPLLLWQLWQFVAVGLRSKERRMIFLFVPLGVIFFYIGAIVGYFIGLPYMFAWLLQFSAHNRVIHFELRQSEYIDAFVFWTVCFGLIMDIPWLVMVLVRTGLVTPAQIGKARKIVIATNIIIAACISPTGDPISILALALPMQGLFEAGLLASRFLVPKRAPAEDSTPR